MSAPATGSALAAGDGLPPLSLYVHFPWCVRKCPYCDFNSHALRAELPEARYIDALLADLDTELPHVQGRALQSIFLGGGTPSLFSPASMARLLEGARAAVHFAADIEITLEANPGTIERGRFADYRAAGITRVSLGAQSFSDAQLQQLGRIHAADDTRRAASELHAAGLANFNLDLMYALPRQSAQQACEDIEAALALRPAHLSHYQLTLEPGTLFAAQTPAGLPDADAAADLQQACQERLADAGFVQYEVSAYAREGARCRHNLNYWAFGDYLGIGAGAHGKRSGGSPLRVTRSTRAREPRRYLAAVEAGAAATEQRVAPEQLPFEYLLNALRLAEGFSPLAFEQRTGLPRQVIAQTWGALERRGLLMRTQDRWRASERGFELLNELLAEFLPDSVATAEAPLGRADRTAGVGSPADPAAPTVGLHPL